MSALVFNDVDKSYQRSNRPRPDVVLKRFSLEIKPGELVAIVGPSGIGKTTLLHLAAGLQKPDRGSIEIGQKQDVRIGMVFQQPRLLDWLTVEDNIRIAMGSAGQHSDRGMDLLGAVGLSSFAKAYPATLSGGQRQRVALVRAFAIDPDIVLLDEPFSALDEMTARRLRITLQNLWTSREAAGLLVTHSSLEAALLADRVIILEGPPARISKTIENPIVRPRNAEDPGIFEMHRTIISELERTALVD